MRRKRPPTYGSYPDKYTCQWIFGDNVKSPDKCGKKTVPGTAWCEDHLAKAYPGLRGSEFCPNHKTISERKRLELAN